MLKAFITACICVRCRWYVRRYSTCCTTNLSFTSIAEKENYSNNKRLRRTLEQSQRFESNPNRIAPTQFKKQSNQIETELNRNKLNGVETEPSLATPFRKRRAESNPKWIGNQTFPVPAEIYEGIFSRTKSFALNMPAPGQICSKSATVGSNFKPKSNQGWLRQNESYVPQKKKRPYQPIMFGEERGEVEDMHAAAGRRRR